MLSQVARRASEAARSITTSAQAGATITRPFSSTVARSNSDDAKYGTVPLPAKRFDYEPSPHTGLSYDEVAHLRQKYLSPSLRTFTAFKKPMMFTRAKYQYLWDHEGKRYLDLLAQNLTISVGHNHPVVQAAAKEQMDKMQHATVMYLHEQNGLAAKSLVERLPPPPKGASEDEDWVVHFVNSGAEAVDLAILLARTYTGVYDMLAIRNSYHGLSASTMQATGLWTAKQPVIPTIGMHHVVQPDLYRGPHTGPDAGVKYAEDVKDVIQYSTSGRIAGFLFEQVQGFGGVHRLPDGYLAAAFKHTKDAGGVTIADEVQTGFGRTGTHYWGFESQGVDPDIVVMGKGLGNGVPVAAIATKRRIAESMCNRFFFNTYGGNPTNCRVGRAVMDVIDDEGIQANALNMGNLFTKKLREVQAQHPDIIGDVRQGGMFIGVEIVHDAAKKVPGPQEAIEIFEMCKNMGLILGKGGMHGNILRVMPPMCINEDDAQFTQDVLSHAIDLYKKTRK